MKLKALVFSLFIFLQASAQEDYTIFINGTPYKVTLNKNYDLTVDGKKVSVSVKLNDTLTYNDDFLSFKYPSNFSVSKTKLEEGIEQLTIMTAEGSGILIQKYSTFNPAMLTDMLLSEVTKESVSYGYVMTREDYKRTIKSGQNVEIKKAVLKYKDEVNIYEVTSAGKKDEGVLVMTMKMDNLKESAGQKLINLMWSTLSFK